MYTRSVEQSREQSVSVQTLARVNHQQEGESVIASANHEIDFHQLSCKIQDKDDNLASAKAMIAEQQKVIEQLRKENCPLPWKQVQPKDRVSQTKAKKSPVSVWTSDQGDMISVLDVQF